MLQNQVQVAADGRLYATPPSLTSPANQDGASSPRWSSHPSPSLVPKSPAPSSPASPNGTRYHSPERHRQYIDNGPREPSCNQAPRFPAPKPRAPSPPRLSSPNSPTLASSIVYDCPTKLAPATPRTAGQMPRSMDLLDLHEDYRHGGIWGIGMSIQKEPPHAVIHVDDLQDQFGLNCNHLVAVGDQLLRVDDIVVTRADMESLETFIFGPLDTIVKLSFACSQGGPARPFTNYDISVKRHIPISTWDQVVRWYALKPDFTDSDFYADNKIVKVLEDMRVYAHDGSGNIADLLKVSPLEHSSLGILISQNVSSYRGDHSPRFGSTQSQQRNCSFFVQEVTLGGPAYLTGKVQVGDFIVAVEGEEMNDLVSTCAAVRGCDAIGTPCTITFERDNKRFDVELLRGSNTRVRSMGRLFKLLQTAEAHSLRGNMEAVLKTMGLFTEALAQSELQRMHRESCVSERLARMQATLFNGITTAEKSLHPLQAQRPPPAPFPLPESELRRLREESDALRAANESLKRQVEANESLKRQVDALRYLDALSIELKRQQSVLSSQVDALTEHNENLKRDRTALESQLAALKRENTHQKCVILDFEGQLEALKLQLASLKKELVILEGENEELKRDNLAQMTAVQSQVKILSNDYQILYGENAVLKRHVSDLDETIADLKKCENCLKKNSPLHRHCEECFLCKKKEAEPAAEKAATVAKEKKTVQRSAAPAKKKEAVERETLVGKDNKKVVLQLSAAPATKKEEGPKRQCGIGLMIVMMQEVANASAAVMVKSVLEGSPAQLCGKISAGDELLSVNGVEVAGRTLESVFAMVKGDEGSSVNLELYSHSQGKKILVSVTRCYTTDFKALEFQESHQRVVSSKTISSTSISSTSASSRTLTREATWGGESVFIGNNSSNSRRPGALHRELSLR